jgi:glutamate-1-semialdehyde aminotransferase
VGPAAAIATIKKLKALNVPSHLCRVGKMIGDGWQALAKKHNLNVKVMNILPLITFKFDYQDDSQAIHTLFNQEMLKRGYLVTKSVYVSYAHKEKDVVAYLAVADKVFKLIKEAIDKKAVHKMLKGPIAHQGFRRLT